MPLVKLYFSPALLLLLMVTCSVWNAGQSRPTCQPITKNSQGLITDSHADQALSLLRDITKTLEKKQLFIGFDCQKQNVELHVNSSTPSVCEPKGSTCSGDTKSSFDQESCVKEIGKDLRYYYKYLIAQKDPDNVLTMSILPSLTGLMKNCRVSVEMPPTKDSAPMKTDANNSTYDARVKLCKTLKGFQVRAITINRAIGYMRDVQTMEEEGEC